MIRKIVTTLLWCAIVVASSTATFLIFTRDNVESPNKPSVFADTVKMQIRPLCRHDY